jgi:23S rRNA G2445 N2-methylase RlmL
MSLFTHKSKILITCPKGIAPYMKDEILSLGFPDAFELTAGVETAGTLEDAMALNLSLRTGHRVLYLIDAFDAHTHDDLYDRIVGLPWEDYIEKDGYISVTSSVDTHTVRDPRFVNLRCKDAIADRFVDIFGIRPDSGPRRHRTVIHIFWQDFRCLVYIDTSGESLSKHGYRKISLKAPMQETLAAATVLATGWSGDGHFVNPMCGSGTLAIEAALIAVNKAPGLLRTNFGFMHVKGFDALLWKKLRKEARMRTHRTIDYKIIASDIKSDAVRAAKKNAMTAGVDHLIDFYTCNFSNTPVPKDHGIIVLNPEYGERLGQVEHLKDTYRAVGDFFKQECTGYRGFIFTGNLELAKHVGLRTTRRTIFFNSNIECRLLEYNLYEGSRKAKSPA